VTRPAESIGRPVGRTAAPTPDAGTSEIASAAHSDRMPTPPFNRGEACHQTASAV